MPILPKLILGVLAVLLFVGVGLFVVRSGTLVTTLPVATTTDGTGGNGGTACSMEARICPDGSAIGRTGPNCEFAACPVRTGTTPYTSGAKGVVTLGPTCPVMKDPPDPQCADKGYATTVSVSRSGSTATFATTKSDANGAFTFSLPPGSYTVSAAGGRGLPRCSPVEVTVAASGYVTADISCDTGIR